MNKCMIVKDINILIVDASMTINHFLNDSLSSVNYQCAQAFTLKEARIKINKTFFDYIILDINLPDEEGTKLLKDLDLKKNKVIILTSNDNFNNKESFFRSGILDYFVKNKSLNDIFSQINSLIKQVKKNKYLNKLLIIEEKNEIRLQAKNILNLKNYESFFANNEKKSFDIIKKKNISLIILDICHDINYNISIIKEIKNINKNIPIILVSKNKTLHMCYSLKMGVDHFIEKPYFLEELIVKVDLLCEKLKIEKEFSQNQLLLTQYKDIVDLTFHVSKANEFGEITYINDNYEKTLGFSKKETLGKTHDLIKDPTTPSSLYKNIWNTIKYEKKVWNGVIKNITKDNQTFYMDTTIKPILDLEGKVLEYISIKNDVTEIEKSKEYLEYKNYINNSTVEESNRVSYMYKEAINESSNVIRINLDKKITYVNKSFLEISSYKKEDLINKDYLIIQDINTNNSNFFKELEKGNIYKKSIKSIYKDNNTYYSNITVFPIVDKKNNIIEYMEVRHDITDVVKLHKELENTQRELIYSMGEIGERRSQETGNHVKRVAEYSKLFAQKLNLKHKDIDLVYLASPMHDIGKVGIPDNILNKKGKLTYEEFEIMKTHSELGYNVLKGSTQVILKAAAIISYTHHEKYDGSGYPNGLKADNIHIFGRITAIADVFDALGSDRCYKKAWPLAKILQLIKEEKSKHFDPLLVDIFLESLDEFLEIRDKYLDI